MDQTPDRPAAGNEGVDWWTVRMSSPARQAVAWGAAGWCVALLAAVVDLIATVRGFPPTPATVREWVVLAGLAGSLLLPLGLVGGTLAGAVLVRLVPLRRWLRLAIVVVPPAVALALKGVELGARALPWEPVAWIAGLAMAGGMLVLHWELESWTHLRRVLRTAAIVTLVTGLVALTGARAGSRRLCVAKTWFSSAVLEHALAWSGAALPPAPAGDAHAAQVQPMPRFESGHPLARPDWNVLLVTLDSLRYDRLLPLMPAATGLAADAWRFTRAYTRVPTSPYAMASMLAGRAAAALDLAEGPGGELVTAQPPADQLLAALGRRGVRTLAVVPAFRELRPGGSLVSAFGEVVSVPLAGQAHVGPEETSEATTTLARKAIGDLAPGGAPWLLWVHYLDPHAPYLVHEDAAVTGPGVAARYDGEVRHADLWLGRLLDDVAARPDADRTVVVLASDHGEQLAERGRMASHGFEVTEEEVRVPLIVKVPGAGAQVIEQPVALSDLPATLLNLYGIDDEGAWAGLQGRNLLTVAAAPKAPTRVFTEAWAGSSPRLRRVAVVEARWKGVWDGRSATFTGFDLLRDPGERSAGDRVPPEEGTRLRELLLTWMAAHPLDVPTWPRVM